MRFLRPCPQAPRSEGARLNPVQVVVQPQHARLQLNEHTGLFASKDSAEYGRLPFTLGGWKIYTTSVTMALNRYFALSIKSTGMASRSKTSHT
jgi:hypothetical protein